MRVCIRGWLKPCSCFAVLKPSPFSLAVVCEGGEDVVTAVAAAEGSYLPMPSTRSGLNLHGANYASSSQTV